MWALLNALPAGAQENVDAPAKATDQPADLESNIPSTAFGRSASKQGEQIQCKSADCTELYYPGNSDVMEERLIPLFEQKAGKILVHFKIEQPLLSDEGMTSIRVYIREIAKRGGRVTVEPLYIGFRGTMMPPLPLVSDLISVGYSLGSRIYNYFAYQDMELYHAKVVVHPQTQRVLYVFFVHRSYGDPCSTLYSDCNSMTYLDEETFDAVLSERLEEAQKSGKSVSVDFSQTPAVLPRGTLDLAALNEMSGSARIYKWFVAARETERIKKTREKFLPLTAAVSILKYSMQAYDIVQAIRTYAPARQMRAQIFYEEEGEQKTGRIKSVIFTPVPAN